MTDTLEKERILNNQLDELTALKERVDRLEELVRAAEGQVLIPDRDEDGVYWSATVGGTAAMPKAIIITRSI
jgi:hypothetical protein